LNPENPPKYAHETGYPKLAIIDDNTKYTQRLAQMDNSRTY